MWDGLGFGGSDGQQVARIASRLALVVVLAGALGLERERRGKAAGLRTHILVALGSAVFTMAVLELGADDAALSRVIQGIATGIGFIGAGTILKPDRDESHVKGLTTAAGVWLTAAIGMVVGAGLVWLPVIATVLALIVVAVLGRLERLVTKHPDQP
jgi:putative Mg2+ transporter-C (MgtC) family protein